MAGDTYHYVITLQSPQRDGTMSTSTSASTYRVRPRETRGEAFAAILDEALTRARVQSANVLFWSFEPNDL